MATETDAYEVTDFVHIDNIDFVNGIFWFCKNT